MSDPLFPAETQSFLKALASETRQHIVQELATGNTLTVGDIAKRCGIGFSTASEQLAILKQGGLVTSTRHGKQVLYQADPTSIGAHLKTLSAYLSACCPPTTDTAD
ncbi:ArsR/SmtB family transcription factor [Jonesia quinghaiensis]|uniref:ArsR/SmtB family transcription factor n=1 Tax=Jonesia quinghaiensis TaxID=262806 RepID=UPI00041CFEEF|nr:metalloregulator ArsR/SmtB family transcription factor [Jonesia quinghaiensis]